MAHSSPSIQARIVPAGMSGSSVFATAERTSGYGDSSSTWSKAQCRSWEETKAFTEVFRVQINVGVSVALVIYNALLRVSRSMM